MTKIEPAIPRGMRDFTPQEMQRRKYILQTIEEVFQQYGFQQIETPAMEKREVLMGKYGQEGDKLIFNILNSGDYLSDVGKRKLAEKAGSSDKQEIWELEYKNAYELTPDISKRALRYDLTVPLARYVAQHQHEIAFPFKRYQIQPVWRADKPQKGRYREFFQCDADVIGSTSLLTDAELMEIFVQAFQQLGLENVTIRFNHRQLLYSMTEQLGVGDQFMGITIAIDKLDKIGTDGVKQELQDLELSQNQVEKILEYIQISGDNEEMVNELEDALSNSESANQALSEVNTILNYLNHFELGNINCQFDLSLARGLDYYTGTIYEVEAENVDIGSIAAGGRYDDLCSTFGLDDVSGIGISFGVDRIYDVMEELDLFPTETQQSTQVMITNFNEEAEKKCLPYLQKLRQEGINAEIYPDQKKLGKQFKYAHKKGIPYVIVAGPEELESGELELKEMESGEQKALKWSKIVNQLKTSGKS